MTIVIFANIALAVIVFSAVISMLVWGIRGSVSLNRRSRSGGQIAARGVTRTGSGSLRQAS